MTRAEAVELVHELVSAEVDVVNQNNSRSGGITKRAAQREASAAKAIFLAMVGETPEHSEIEQMIGG